MKYPLQWKGTEIASIIYIQDMEEKVNYYNRTYGPPLKTSKTLQLFNSSLRTAYDQLVLHLQNLNNYGTIINTHHLSQIICDNFPRFLWENRVNLDDSVEQLLDCIDKAIHVKVLIPHQKKMDNPTKTTINYNTKFQKNNTNPIFFNPTKQQRYHPSNKKNYKYRRFNKKINVTDLSYVDSIPIEVFKIPFQPKNGSWVFCNGKHWSSMCFDVRYNTLQARNEFYKNKQLCKECGKDRHMPLCKVIASPCQWPSCKNHKTHLAKLCPMAKYPLSWEIYNQ